MVVCLVFAGRMAGYFVVAFAVVEVRENLAGFLLLKLAFTGVAIHEVGLLPKRGTV